MSVVLIHWNRPDALSETVAAFEADPKCGNIIVVDNGSEPAALRSLVRLGRAHPVELIELDGNTGFGPATNRGWERWLTSHDTEWCVTAPHDALPAPATIARLLAAGSADDSIGLVSADVGDGTTPVVDHVFGPISRPAAVESGFERSDYPHGTMFMIRRRCLEQVGGFDERYFAYCEEADLGLRAKQAGWKVGLVRGARVFNTGVGTGAPTIDYLMERNTLLLIADHFGRRKAVLRGLIGLLQLVQGVIRPATRGPFWSPRARLRALFDATTRRFGPPPGSVLSRSTPAREVIA